MRQWTLHERSAPRSLPIPAAAKPIACLRTQSNAPLGVIADVLDQRDLPWRYVDLWLDQPVPATDDIAGLIVLGGSMNVDETERHPWLRDVRRLTAAAAEAELPVLGVCLGAQVLARAGGAAVHRDAVREIGFTTVDVVSGDPVTAAFAPSSPVFQFHADVCELPAGAKLLARGEQVPVQAFRMGATAYGVQFHFEVTPEIIASWCDEQTPEVFRADWSTTKEQLLADAEVRLPRQQAAGRRLVAAWADLLGGGLDLV